MARLSTVQTTTFDFQNYATVDRDYQRTPVKLTIPRWPSSAHSRLKVRRSRAGVFHPLRCAAPGALDMVHLRAVLESRPFLTRVPDQSVISNGARCRRSTRDAEGSYVLVYLPGDSVTVRLDPLTGPAVRASWFDSRQGAYRVIDEFPPGEAKGVHPPVVVRTPASTGHRRATAGQRTRTIRSPMSTFRSHVRDSLRWPV